MKGLHIQKSKIVLHTTDGEYGFECTFNSGLNIIRGNNSSGKSTLINALIYSLGMEEILGGRGIKTLPYALKEYVENERKDRIKILSSYVYLEICNNSGSVVTLKRAINSTEKNTKLIEVIRGCYLTKPDEKFAVSPMFLHDKGSAQNTESGYFSFLENFIGISLPIVTGSNDGEVKLYLQTIFSAIFVEQKRGWTDYIANTPYYAIRDVRTKIVEFILGLDVFENDRRRAALLANVSELQSNWTEEKLKIRLTEEEHSISVAGIKRTIDEMFDPNLVSVSKYSDGSTLALNQYMISLIQSIEAIEKRERRVRDDVSLELLETYNESKSDLDKLISLYDSSNSELRLSKSRLSEYVSNKSEIEKDLEKNKIAKKLKYFGAKQDLHLSRDSCPACHQHIDDSLFLADTLFQPMSIDENIKYLESQRKMVTRFIRGLEHTISELESQLRDLSESTSEKHASCLSLKKQIRLTGSATESDLRVKLQIESKIEKISKAEEIINKSLSQLEFISNKFTIVRAEIVKIPERNTSADDHRKYTEFQRFFRKYANTFGYSSAPIADVEINRDTLFPYLSGLELREVNTDIKSDSSASDFVRLIWAYLLSIFSASEGLGGNHVGLLVFDEPGQHSMAVTSVNSLLKTLSNQSQLQSIVAASFDESDEIFSDSVLDVNFHLIEFGTKLLRPTV